MSSKMLLKRAAVLAVTLVVAMYVTILVANGGGYIDNLILSELRQEAGYLYSRNPLFRTLPIEEQNRLIEERVQLSMKARGLDKPFIVRSFIYLVDALTLNLGRALFIRSAGGSSSVRDIIFERLPQTVLLFSTGTVLYIAIGIYLGLVMTKNIGGKFDRGMTMFAIVASVIPPWFIGIISILIFVFYLRLFPFGGMLSVPPPADPLSYALDILYHMVLPLFSWVITGFPYWAYITRNILVQISQEDFVMAARAKGLPDNNVMTDYILRPGLPPIVTNSALTLITSWMGAIITETVFEWPGVGGLMNAAISRLDAPVVIGITVIYGYLLVATVLILDAAYALLDPRIRVSKK